MNTITPLSANRIQSVDALRGFALAGIVLVHMVENYVGAATPEGAMAGGNSFLNGIAFFIIEVFLRGKFFALFSFLFGLSFFIQLNNAEQRGTNLSGRFLWRLLLLLGIGYVHSLFYRGDILTIYAIIGMILIPFYQLSNRWLWIIFGVLMLGAGRYLIFSLFGTDNLFIPFDMGPQSPEIATYFETLRSGTLWEVWQTNGTQGHIMKADFQLGVMGRAYLTLTFFILGLLAGRYGFFQTFQEQRKLWRKRLFWCLGLFLLSGLLTGMLFTIGNKMEGEGGAFGLNNIWHMMGLSSADLINFWMFCIIVIGFMLLFGKENWRRRLMIFAPYGRTALTNYFCQTLIGTFLLFGWGLGYIGQWPAYVTFTIGIAIIVLQLWLSKWWLQHYRFGPLEWLWRSLTYFRWYDFKKGN